MPSIRKLRGGRKIAKPISLAPIATANKAMAASQAATQGRARLGNAGPAKAGHGEEG